MKRIVIIGMLFLWQFSNAQTHKSDLHWLMDFEQAKKVAKKEHKPIVMLFTGSDCCPPCKMMHNELFVNKDFIKLSNKVVLLMVDFPRRKPMSAEQRRKNGQLQQKFHRGGVPTFVAVSYNEKVLGKISGYMRGKPERDIAFFKSVIEKNKKVK